MRSRKAATLTDRCVFRQEALWLCGRERRLSGLRRVLCHAVWREDLGTELELVSVDAPNRVEYLTSAKVDVILANFTVTPERAEVVDFALPYMKVALGVVSPDGALITDVSRAGR